MTRYSRHARRRMRQRDVSEAEVEAVLASPSERHRDAAGHDVLIGWPGGRRIRVVAAHDAAPSFIITVAARPRARRRR